MKILGIGNAIIDVICKVEDSYLSNNGLTKGAMELVDEIKFKKLLSNLKIEETVSGGSVANSIVGLSQLGNKVGFIGKINDDDFGQQYEDGLRKENVNYFYSKKKERHFYAKRWSKKRCWKTKRSRQVWRKDKGRAHTC